MIEVELPDGTIAEFPEGTSNDVIKATLQRQAGGGNAPSPWMDTAKDVGASMASGIGRGVAGVAGIPGTIGDAFNSGMSWLTGLPELPKSPFSSAGLQRGLSVATGGASDYEPKTTAGEYSGTVGEFIPGAVVGGLGAGNLLRFGVLPGVASEAAGQATEGTSLEPYARVAAALASPALPALASRAVSPFSGAISPERQKAIAALQAEGVPLSAGQQTGSKALQFAESELGGGRASSLMDNQARAFTEAATSRAGMQGIATPENMAANAERLGQGFQSISARNAIKADPQFGNDIGRVLSEYDRVLPSAQREIVNNMATDIKVVKTVFVVDTADVKKATSDYNALAKSIDNTGKELTDTGKKASEGSQKVKDGLDKSKTHSPKTAVSINTSKELNLSHISKI